MPNKNPLLRTLLLAFVLVLALSACLQPEAQAPASPEGEAILARAVRASSGVCRRSPAMAPGESRTRLRTG